MFGFFRSYFSNDLAIDLGTANTLIYMRERGIVLDEPSVVAIRQEGGPNGKKTILAVGKEAKAMLGRVPGNIEAIRPMKDGVIADFTITEQRLKQVIKLVHESKLLKPSPRIILCVPCGSTQVERRAIRESALGAGASQVFLIEEPMAAAIGSGLPVSEAAGSMVVDIGGGTTEIAVLAMGGIVCDKSIKVAGDVFTNDIALYMRAQHNLYVGERTAENIKIAVGAAQEELDEIPEPYSVQGRDLLSGKPKQVQVTHMEVARALEKSITRVEDAVMEALSNTPPELAADIYNSGIYLAGGGSMLRGLDKRISAKTDLPVYVAEDPLRAVVRGTGIVLKNIEHFKTILES